MHIDKNNQEILVVVDMQNDFIDGVLANPAAKNIVPAVVEEIRQWKGKVVATRDTHFESNYAESIEGKLLPIHCVYGTKGWEIEPSIQKALEDQMADIVDKHNFGFINWPKVLFGIDSIDQDAVAALTAGKEIRLRFLGTCTDICDLSNIAICRAWFPDATIEVVDGATASSFDNSKQPAALEMCKSMLCNAEETVYGR